MQTNNWGNSSIEDCNPDDILQKLHSFRETDRSEKICLQAAEYIENLTILLAEKSEQVKNALAMRNEYKQAGEQACKELDAARNEIQRYKKMLEKMLGTSESFSRDTNTKREAPTKDRGRKNKNAEQ